MPRKSRSRARGKQAKVEEPSSKISEEMKEAVPTICLYVDHFPHELNSSIYMIRPPLDLSEHDEDQMILIDDSDTDSGYDSKQNITILKTGNPMDQPAFVNVDSKIYFFGGSTKCVDKPASELDTLSRRVQVIDINDPQQKIQSVASMHTPKYSPCVFVVDSLIYVIAPDNHCTGKLPDSHYTGLFECYDPNTNTWQVLPDPPFFDYWVGARLFDCATVIGRRVIIGCPFLLAIYDLDSRIWDPLSPLWERPLNFPFGSRFVQQSASLYQVTGLGSPTLRNFVSGQSPLYNLETAVRRFPVTLRGNFTELLKNNRLISGEAQIMAQATDLDDNKPFTERSYSPQRFFFHLGGCFFCYVVTAQLCDQFKQTQYEPYSRAVFIKFFKEVPAPTDNSKCGSYNNNEKSNIVFRPVASFCYKITSTFPHHSVTTRCSVIGTVPDSWMNSPPKKKQESKSSCPEPEKAVNVKPYEAGELEKLLAAREAEIKFLKAELARKEEFSRTRDL